MLLRRRRQPDNLSRTLDTNSPISFNKNTISRDFSYLHFVGSGAAYDRVGIIAAQGFLPLTRRGGAGRGVVLLPTDKPCIE